MKSKSKSALIWILVLIFTVAIAYYQRKTGPSYPISGDVVIDNNEISYSLTRSWGEDGNAEIKITAPDNEITGIYTFKRYNHPEDWITSNMKRDGEFLVISLPHQPPAGKIQYLATLSKGEHTYSLCEKPVVIRFRGGVPLYIIIAHALIMFVAMLFSTRTGIEAIMKGVNTYKFALVTIITLFVGGLLLGPVVQKYAFGEYWTGWPFGGDLTDNKTLVAFIFWLIAVIRLRKNKYRTGWAIVAAIVLLAIYFIPHSMFGSELDYTTGEVVTGE